MWRSLERLPARHVVNGLVHLSGRLSSGHVSVKLVATAMDQRSCLQVRPLRTSGAWYHPQQQQPQHDSLSSFIAYTERTSLSPASTVYQGTLYEYRCQDALARFGFRLQRTGGAGDAGIDLEGEWHLPSLSSGSSGGGSGGSSGDGEMTNAIFLPAVVQCKALARKTGPAQVRELEGALAPKRPNTVGVLCSTRPATRAVRDTLKISRRPLVWMQVEQPVAEIAESEADKAGEIDGVDGQAAADGKSLYRPARVRQMLWNEKVEMLGARGIDVTLLRGGDGERDGDGDGEIALLWQGKIWRPSDSG